MTRRRNRLICAAVALLVFFVLIPFALFPFLAITEPSGSDAVVIEGWIPQERIQQIMAEIRRNGYKRIYTTGTIREATYYLRNGDTLYCSFDPEVSGEIRANLSGRDGAIAYVLADTDTVMQVKVEAANTGHRTNRTGSFSELRLISSNSGIVPEKEANIYLKSLTIGGKSIHALQRTMHVGHAENGPSPGRPTYAEALAYHLKNAGVDPERITALPSPTVQGGHTWSNAKAFAAFAKKDGIVSVDVLSMGVHARRSRHMYQLACGEQVQIGVVSITDPLAKPDNWWSHRIGWATVLKEIIGLPTLLVKGSD